MVAVTSRRRTLAGQLLVLQLAIIVVVLVAVAAVSLAQSAATFNRVEGRRVAALGEELAGNPLLRDRLNQPAPARGGRAAGAERADPVRGDLGDRRGRPGPGGQLHRPDAGRAARSCSATRRWRRAGAGSASWRSTGRASWWPRCRCSARPRGEPRPAPGRGDDRRGRADLVGAAGRRLVVPLHLPGHRQPARGGRVVAAGPADQAADPGPGAAGDRRPGRAPGGAAARHRRGGDRAGPAAADHPGQRGRPAAARPARALPRPEPGRAADRRPAAGRAGRRRRRPGGAATRWSSGAAGCW